LIYKWGMESNPYDAFDLQPGVSPEALKRRYRERLREVHPDLHPEDPDAAKKTQHLVEAYEYLSDPERRGALDQRLRESQAPPPRPTQPRETPPVAPPRPASPRRSQLGRTTTSYSQSTVIINGQRIDVSGSGSVNVVVNNSGIHVQTDTQDFSTGDVGDVTMGTGAMSDLVMGDLHIRAGSAAHISGKVMGDVFVAGNSQVTISGKVLGDVHAKGSSLRVLGMVMGDLFVDADSAEILGVHLGDLL
jgi:hypothetical protein